MFMGQKVANLQAEMEAAVKTLEIMSSNITGLIDLVTDLQRRVEVLENEDA